MQVFNIIFLPSFFLNRYHIWKTLFVKPFLVSSGKSWKYPLINYLGLSTYFWMWMDPLERMENWLSILMTLLFSLHITWTFSGLENWKQFRMRSSSRLNKYSGFREAVWITLTCIVLLEVPTWFEATHM